MWAEEAGEGTGGEGPLEPTKDNNCAIEQLKRNVLAYTATHKEQLKTQALPTHSLRLCF